MSWGFPYPNRFREAVVQIPVCGPPNRRAASGDGGSTAVNGILSCMDADAVVIGAGAAGLTAARSLAENSLRVIVLEARNRTGGRVWVAPRRPAP